MISGAEELRVKESDRIAAMGAELRKMGVHVIEQPDGMMIQGVGNLNENGRLIATTCQSHGDHRVAMSLAIAGLTASSNTVIDDTACIGTSFPDFQYKLLELLTKDS